MFSKYSLWSTGSIRSRWHRTERPFAEALGFETERVIEPCPVIFPGDVGSEFHQLHFIELGVKLGQQSLGNFGWRVRHCIGIGEDNLLGLREQAAALIVVKVRNLFLRDAVLSADGRPDVDSKQTAHQRRDPQSRKLLQRPIDAMAGQKRLLHLPVSPENCRVMRRHLYRHVAVLAGD